MSRAEQRRAGFGAERLDVLAYLVRRRDNAARVVAQMPGMALLVADRRRQLEVMIDEIEAGLHEGLAAVLAELAATSCSSAAFSSGPARAAEGSYPFTDHRSVADCFETSGYAEEG